MMKGLYMTIIPAGQEVELQGLYAFFSQVLAFLPGVWFGYSVEAELGGESNSRRFGMLGIVAFHLIGGSLMSVFLDEKKALEIAGNTKHLRVRGKVFIDGGGGGTISNTLSEKEDNAVL